MAYETQVIMKLLAESIGRAKTIKEAYNIVVRAASNEGVKVPSYDELLKIIEDESKE
jgi:hypothetical protein